MLAHDVQTETAGATTQATRKQVPSPRTRQLSEPLPSPRTPTQRSAILTAPVYSSGSRKRSLGLGRIDYVAAAAEGEGTPAERAIQSPRSSSHTAPSLVRRESDYVHARKEAQRISADEVAELQNLRDMNHTLWYELSMERSESNDCKRQMAARRVELQQTKDERGAWQAEVSFMPIAVVV